MKKVWKLCWGLVVIMTVMAVNFSAVDAEAVFQPPEPIIAPDCVKLTHLVGDYRVVAVYRGGGEFIDGRDTGTVIRIGYNTDSLTSCYINGKFVDVSSLEGMPIEAPSNSRFSGYTVDNAGSFFDLSSDTDSCDNPNAIAKATLEFFEPSVEEGEYAGHVVIYSRPELRTSMVVNGDKISFYTIKNNEPVFEMERIN